MTSRSSARPRERRALGLILAAGIVYFLTCLWIASHFATWIDEEYTLATTARGPAYAFTRSMNYELQAPLYFVILAVWRELDGAVWFARLFSIACATGLFFAFVIIGRRIAPDRNPLPFALLAALSPFVLDAAFDIRLYALALLLSACGWIAFDRGFLSAESGRARFAFACLMVAGAYVEYFLAFALCGFGLALLAVRRRSLSSYAVVAGLAAAAMTPLALATRSQVGQYEVPRATLPHLLRLHAIHPLLDFVFPYPSFVPHAAGLHVAYYVVALAAAIALVWARPALDRSAVALLVAAAGIQITYLVALALLRLDLETRYFVALYVPVVGAAYGVFVAVRKGPRPWAALAFLPVLVGLPVVLDQYRSLAVSGDWKRVATYLEGNAKAGDVIAIFPADAVPAFVRQYRGAVPYVPFPRAYSRTRYSVRDLTIATETQARQALERLERYKRIWLVTAGQCFPERAYGCDKLAALASAAKPLLRMRFFQSEVYLIDGSSVAREMQPSAQRVRQIAQARYQEFGRREARQP